jgi:hypothetical protein
MIRAVAGGVLPIVIAGVLDRWWGEPPLRAHPVRAIGRLLDLLGRGVPMRPSRPALLHGGAAWLVGLVATTGIAVTVDGATARLPAVWTAAARGVALWPLVSLRMLIDEVATVEEALAADVDERGHGPFRPPWSPSPASTVVLIMRTLQGARKKRRKFSWQPGGPPFLSRVSL